MFFAWIRRQARDAILGGVTEALDELDRDLAPADVEAARKRFALPPEPKALAAAKGDDEPAKGRGGKGK